MDEDEALRPRHLELQLRQLLLDAHRADGLPTASLPCPCTSTSRRSAPGALRPRSASCVPPMSKEKKSSL